ncbi:hypothetical protein K501DRAFT_273716 [Backusella circina FSU 941]|nr:hypothetical protein K501DRAFT_273716 [Backusella circina FSU 941]
MYEHNAPMMGTSRIMEKIEVGTSFTISYIVECCYEIRSPNGKVGCGTQRMNSRDVLACASDSFHRPAGLTNNKEDGVGLIILGLAPISASRMEILPFPIILERSLSMFLNNSYVMGFGKKTGRNSWSVEPGKCSKTTISYRRLQLVRVYVEVIRFEN